MNKTLIVMDEVYYAGNVMQHIAEEGESLMWVHCQFGKPAVVIECAFDWQGDNTLGFVRENFDEDSAIGEFYTAIAEAPLSMYRLVSVSDDKSTRAFGNLEIPGLIPYAQTQICWR